MKKNSEFLLEESVLNDMLVKIDENILKLDENIKEKKEMLNELYSLYNNPEDMDSNFFSHIPAQKQLIKQYTKSLEDYKKIINNPYFGKILFKYEDSDKKNIIYFGKKGLNDFTKNEIPIVDWRTPIANVYYSCKLGKTSFQAPDSIVNIDLVLKRTLKIRNSVLKSIYDSDIIANDELLVNYLSQNKELVLKEIIATIQDEQNEIIRKPFNMNLIVQGVAGSGKTTVALHRVSYLLYSYNEITSENVYLIAANPLFLNYITSMLPDLDVPVIKQYTVEDIIISEFEELFKEKYSIVKGENPIYNNDTFINTFEMFFDKIGKNIFDIETLLCFGFDLLSDYDLKDIIKDKTLDIFSKAKMLDSIIMDNIVFYKSYIISYILNNYDNLTVKEDADAIFCLKNPTTINLILEKNYYKLKQKYKNYFYKKVENLNATELYYSFLNKQNKIELSFNDIACYLLFHLKVNGSSKNINIKHIVIDEAQDFNIVIHYFIRAMFPNANFIVVGDIMQKIESDGFDNWDMLKYLYKPKVEYLEMNKSYRNTYEISMFTKQVIEKLTNKAFNVNPLKRHGDSVLCIAFNSDTDKKQKIKEILEIQKKSNRRLNAIICKNNHDIKHIYSFLEDLNNLTILNKNSNLEYGNYILDIRNAKGLEFDSVIIWDFDNYSEDETNLAYIAMTRALHNLYVFTNNKEILRLVD